MRGPYRARAGYKIACGREAIKARHKNLFSILSPRFDDRRWVSKTGPEGAGRTFSSGPWPWPSAPPPRPRSPGPAGGPRVAAPVLAPFSSATSDSLYGVGMPNASASRTRALFSASISVLRPASICCSIDGLLKRIPAFPFLDWPENRRPALIPLASVTASASSVILS